MKKVVIFLILSLAFVSLPVRAAETVAVTNTGAPEITIYPSEFDKLVMDFTVGKADGTADTLKALTLDNEGTARNFTDISKVVVWADAGPAGFQGMEIDKKLGEAARYETANYWYLSGLSETVPASGLRIFVSLETAGKGSIVGNKTVQMQVQPLSDSGMAGQFDLGDTGIFLNGGKGLATPVLNPSVQTISYSNYDRSGPKTVVTDPADGEMLGASSYKIKGMARDQGGSTPANVSISITKGGAADAWVNVTNTGENFSAWEYDWLGIVDGTYTIKTQGMDWIGNTATGGGITVTVDQAALSVPSAGISTVSADLTSVSADGVSKTDIAVVVKNSAGNPLAGQRVVLHSSRPEDQIKIIKDTTESDGMAIFELRSTAAGSSEISASVGGVTLAQKPTVQFSSVIFMAGDLIRGTGTAVYYFGSDGKKYLFPTASLYSSWYVNFLGIKKVSDGDILAKPLGGNATVRPGRLVQFVSMDTPWRVMDPKVYAVEKGGVLRHLATADLASAIFGATWEQKIVAVPEVFTTNYTFGPDINNLSDYDLAAQQAVASIDQDKNLE